MDEEEAKRTLNECSVARLLGIEITEVKEGVARGRLSLRKEHLNVWGAAHGGIIFTFADQLGGACAAAAADNAALLESSIHYIKGTKGEKPILAEATLTHRGNTIGRVDVRVYEEGGNLIALVHQIFYIK